MANLQQERHIELVDGTKERFVITSRMTAATIPSQLPHLNVFVLVVVDEDDAKDDTFARVAGIGDLSLLGIGRGNPASNGEYLSSAVTLNYTTLTEALLAATALKDRVNRLINDWVSFTADFNAPDPTPEDFTLPTPDATQPETLIEAYKLAKQDRYLKSLASTEANAALVRAQADFTYKSNLTTTANDLATRGIANETEFVAAKTVFDTLNDAGAAFLAAATCAAAPDQATFQTALNTATNLSTVLQGDVVDAGVLATQIGALQTTCTTDKTTASMAVTAATLDQVTKAQELASAVTLEAAALAVVLAVCPDFDLTSVPLVSG